ncbi:aldose epimerase [Psychromicrobium lacuslunae]|uniref:Aldose epimerase n=1 Tax=Psychromicrobium lacuslunae TaxID=1618207 RepID=A0A0D4C2H7_9MICC|nr:aldose epimerase [Psychromicrobium lacuslunae]
MIAPLAAALRSYSRDGADLVEANLDPVAPGGSGLTLAPWPNRIAEGRWVLEGEVQQLDITEVSRGNAIHGLLRNTGYAVESRSESEVRLVATIYPQHGYPFQLTHRVSYRLEPDESLRVSQSLHNDSQLAAPVALGAHPYLRIAELPTEELRLSVQAGTELLVDEKMIPIEPASVSADSDLRRGRRVAELEMDRSYTDLAFAPDGLARHTLSAPDGRSVTLWQDKACQYVHIYVSTGFPGRNKAVAIEPMSAPANSFNSARGLHWLSPGEEFAIEWGIESVL